jgi:CRP-like cAMP-binding protein
MTVLDGKLQAASAGVDKLLLKLRLRDDVAAEEEQALRAIVEPPVRMASRSVVVREGVPLDRSALLVDGILGRSKDMRDGQRQITELHVPGDFADLHSLTLKRLDQDVIALTDCWISWVPHGALQGITEKLPHLGRLLWLLTNMDAALHRAWTVSLGRRAAPARLAHLLCEMQVRLSVVGMADEHGYIFPITQIDLAECLGLTAVHVNRVLRELREQRLVTFRGGQVSIDDLERLRMFAEFTPDYLFLEKRPR